MMKNNSYVFPRGHNIAKFRNKIRGTSTNKAGVPLSIC